MPGVHWLPVMLATASEAVHTNHVAHVGTYGNYGPWLHFNLGDACPPGHDLPAILSEPKDRTARLNAWEAAVRTWDKGLLWQRRARAAVKKAGGT